VTLRTREPGFTLIEVLAVVALTSIVIGIALDFYIDLSNASTRASEHTREVRRATALLDRLARDFESAVLVTKPPEVDPLAHRWHFQTESRHAREGSDQLKFVTRNHTPPGDESHESDLSVISYGVRRSFDGETLELMRWSSPRLPEDWDDRVPVDEADGAQLMADGLTSFGVRFLSLDGEWSDEWDSTQVLHSSDLPRAVEIQVALAEESDAEDGEPSVLSRRVLLPVRPIDLGVLLDPKLAAARGRLAGEQTEKDPDEEDEAEGENLDRSPVVDPNSLDPDAPNDCGNPRSPVQAKRVNQCINHAVVGPRIPELRNVLVQLGIKDNDPFCRWAHLLDERPQLWIIIHGTCK
jgi:type II secretion system protein J